eukprot:Phypoly_transcript_09347.p1 GENE.Phypoly_transcript_09347~~Phypoly_transcript_09347.p1  ORF type:complete len:279 (-),score=43.48 Phypoly_transcript_09347:168-1004(-)
MEGGVWYMFAVLAVMVGVISKKYLFGTPTSTRLRSNSYPVAGDLMTEIRDKWKRPLETLPVHVDIPRLARKISIYTVSPDKSKQVVLTTQDDLPGGEPTSDNHIIKELIKTLSKHLGEPATQQESIDSNFMEYFKRTADPSLALADFLSTVVGHDSLTAGVLKACNQSVLAPGVLKLKFAIGNYYPYKDARGTWRIEVVVGPDWVSVEHLKREKSFDETPHHYFEFGWSMKLTFDREMQVLRGTELFIDDHKLSDTMSSSTKKKVREVFKPFLRPGEK